MQGTEPLPHSAAPSHPSPELRDPAVALGERQVPAEDALSLVELDWNSRFVETSAKDNENVLEVFRELLQQARLPGRLGPALCRRRETFPSEHGLRPPMNKTNSCSVC